MPRQSRQQGNGAMKRGRKSDKERAFEKVSRDIASRDELIQRKLDEVKELRAEKRELKKFRTRLTQVFRSL